MGKDNDINIVVIGHVDSGDPATTCDLINKLGVTDGKFETSKYHCTITDAPEQADCAVLIIDSTTIVSILSKDGHIQHTLRGFALGRKQLICCCSEMQAAFSKDQYDEIVREASSFLKSLGYDHNKITFVPISVSKGDSVIEGSTNLEWYKGPTLHEAIDQIDGPKMPVRGL
nr:elongation factor 1-alpha-like [Lolium perenne]